MADKQDHIILGVHIVNRIEEAGIVQKVFTEYGCNIRTRIGLHTLTDNVCSAEGLILLEIHGGEAIADDLAAKLDEIEGVETQKLVFKHQ
jgi:hypothetical protein